MTVAVTGSTGELGGRVARRLAGLEHEQRLVVGDPAEGWISSYIAIASGELDAVIDDVERLTGRRPTDLADWLGA